MSDQPLYPYRDTTGSTGQQPADQQQYVPQQYPQQQAQQPQPSYGSPPPQASQQYQMPQPQAYPSQYPSQMGGGYGMGMMLPSNGMAMASLVLGIVGTLISLGGYLSPTGGFFIMLMFVTVPAMVLGLAGIARSRRLGGLKFGHALAGTVLGASAVAIFLVLASSQAGSIADIFNERLDDPVIAVDGDDSDDDGNPVPTQKPGSGSDDMRVLFEKSVWSGFIEILDGEQTGDYATTEFRVDCSNGNVWTFTWDEEDSNYDPKSAEGKFSVLFGQEAMDAATANGFDLDILGGESFASYVQEEDGLDLIYMEFEPDQSDSTILNSGRKVAWFGYMDCQYGEMYTLNVYRLSDNEYQFFNSR